MTDRNAALLAFLARTGHQTAVRCPLAGDASSRRYERLTLPDGSNRVLMDAPPNLGEDIRPFVGVANSLSGLGFSAPKVLAEEAEDGFLLLEDLGDAVFANVIAQDPTAEVKLYEAAIDLLVDLHRATPPTDLEAFTPKVMADLSSFAWLWYATPQGADPAEKAQAFADKFETVLAENVPNCDVLMLRDYHAENLIWLPDRHGTARVGLLDFQDAKLGHRAYDLVSLLQDARRDVSPALEHQMIARYVAASGQDPEGFDRAYHLIGLQRHLRILGVFARLSLQMGKPQYVDFIPRVWKHMLRNLNHPVANEIRDLILQDLPEPTPDFLNQLRLSCGNAPTL